jgi:hypothetical protein
MIFSAEYSCRKPAIPVVSLVGTNLLHDSNDKHNVFLVTKSLEMLAIFRTEGKSCVPPARGRLSRCPPHRGKEPSPTRRWRQAASR